MNISDTIIKRAKLKKGKVVLPEALEDERVMKAVEIIVKKEICELVLLGKPTDYNENIRNSKLVTIIDYNNFADKDKIVDALYERRKDKGLTVEGSKELLKSPIYFASMLVYLGYADGYVAGANTTTRDVLRPALQIIKARKDKNIVAGSVLLLRKKAPNVLLFADASLNEDPTSEQIVDIALGNADFIKDVMGITPKLAFLSYSTNGSASSPLVDKMTLACKLTKEKAPSLDIDGEMQFDCAVDSIVAKKKGINSSVGGNANICVFPDLNAGNIGYKIASKLGGYTAIGPLMVNFDKPVNDLSRGCNVDEIVLTVAITKLQIV